MNSETQVNEADSTEQVMQDVLLAEAEARQKIKDCEQKAQQQLEAARQAAHRISERANLRIARIHKISRELINKEVKSIENSNLNRLLAKPFQFDIEQQQQILQQIADLLTTD
jgi:vacuolar-type H+-ATPase subunit H